MYNIRKPYITLTINKLKIMKQKLIDRYIDIYAKEDGWNQFNEYYEGKNYIYPIINIVKAVNYYNEKLRKKIPDMYFYYFKKSYHLMMPYLSPLGVAVSLFEKVSEDIKSTYNKKDELYDLNLNRKESENFPDYLIIFSEVGNGDFKVFNYNDTDPITNEPSIYYVDHENMPYNENGYVTELDYSKPQEYFQKIASNYQEFIIDNINFFIKQNPDLKINEDEIQ